MMMNKKIDMSFGHPAYLKSWWSAQNDLSVGLMNHVNYPIDGYNMDLVKTIFALHKMAVNAETANRHIVFGNGATQLLQAIIIALGEDVTAKPPYYMNFPKITNLTKHSFIPDDYSGIKSTEIVTLPNNPDNAVMSPICIANNLIYDLSYNWPQYDSRKTGFLPFRVDKDIMVFSLSKAFGLAGLRFGWALFTNKDLADKVKNIIKDNSIGVSSITQNLVEHIINKQIYNDLIVLKHAKKILNFRWKVADLLLKKDINIVKVNNSGMYMVIKVDKKAKEYFLEKYGILGVEGSKFGLDDSYLRLNLGCDDLTFENFIEVFENVKTS